MKPKLFPRNLTAQAARLVTGNPSISRPESGTDVCTPGLEIDLRALEERFFPGLVWDFERGDGARLADMDAKVQGVRRKECIGIDAGVYLLALCARMRPTDAELTFFRFDTGAGRSVWRRVRDLPKDRVAILFGVRERLPERLGNDELHALLTQVLTTGKPKISRPDREFQYAAMAAQRMAYLHPETGVIPDLYAPGELTKGLCSPWQFDFRDCGCNYWAAGKPDMVTSPDPAIGPLNFSRDRTKHGDTPDSPDRKERSAVMYSAKQMTAGAWMALPTVLGDRERNALPAPMLPEGANLFSRQEVASELFYLATVEHSLVVEYLHAAYSTHDRSAATVIQSIAIDEMRHFLWANELLQILEHSPSTGRAKVIGADPALAEQGCVRRRLQPINGRPPTYIHTESKLCSLTLGTLDYFIDVEKNSRTLNGLYTHLYLSIDANPKAFPEDARMLAILRLIIDEGEDHYARLVTVRSHLAGLAPDSWLRRLRDPREPYDETYTTATTCYHLLLHIISVAFRLDDGRPSLLQMAKDLMRDMDESILALAQTGIAFDWPEPVSRDGDTLQDALQRLAIYREALRQPSARLREVLVETESIVRAALASETQATRPAGVACTYRDPHRRRC